MEASQGLLVPIMSASSEAFWNGGLMIYFREINKRKAEDSHQYASVFSYAKVLSIDEICPESQSPLSNWFNARPRTCIRTIQDQFILQWLEHWQVVLKTKEDTRLMHREGWTDSHLLCAQCYWGSGMCRSQIISMVIKNRNKPYHLNINHIVIPQNRSSSKFSYFIFRMIGMHQSRKTTSVYLFKIHAIDGLCVHLIYEYKNVNHLNAFNKRAHVERF